KSHARPILSRAWIADPRFLQRGRLQRMGVRQPQARGDPGQRPAVARGVPHVPLLALGLPRGEVTIAGPPSPLGGEGSIAPLSPKGRGEETISMNRTPILFLNVFLIATCGLVYELLAGTLASYVLGDSVTQFSFVIGIYLFALGVGAWLSRFVEA